ncbi:MAG: lipid-A-disaccharide synthase [Selenomonadaceae bacterium]|nr:lipid-A-disaccharide synthase [Selenomonadaceae bacterium]
MKIMMSAGETSGDLHGAQLIAAIKRQSPTTEIIAFGGDNMAKEGARLLKNFAGYNVMGVWEVIKNLRRIFALLDFLEARMREEKPDLLVLIDYPDFNWRLAKRAKKLSIPVFSYIPPSAWAWRKGRAKTCAKIADEFVAIFPFELPVYEKAGAKISFLGNPLVDKVRGDLTEEEARDFFQIPKGKHAVLLLPGSRLQEIKLLLPTMLAAAEKILQARPDTLFFLPVASADVEAAIREQVTKSPIEIKLTKSHRYDLMGLADVAMATSGTVVLEAALMGLPCVSLYRMAKFNYCLGRLLVHIDNFTLPNILMNSRVQPELLQDEVEPGRIAAEILSLYRGEEKRAKTVAGLKEACSKLGQPGAADRIAAKILAAAKRGGKAT